MSAAAAPPSTGQSDLAAVRTRALIAGFVGLGLCALGALVLERGREQFFRSWLMAFLFWLALPLGSLAILMLHNQTGGRWGLALRRVLEAATHTLPLMALAFLPVALGVYYLYVWSNPNLVEADPLLRHKQPYLNVPAFLIRAAFYFAVWLFLAWRLYRYSRSLDERYDEGVARKMSIFSGPGLGLYGLTVTFAAIDWIMSLEPHWYSTIFGAMIAAAQLLPALAFGVAMLVWLADRPPLSGFLTAQLWNDLGNLLLAFVMIWAYLTFSQFFLIWSGNLPEETVWYRHRIYGGWEVLGWGLIIFYFAAPFVALFSRDLKRNPRRLVWAAGALLVMHLVYTFWLVVPSFDTYHPPGEVSHHHPHLTAHWLDLAAVVGLGGIWVGAFLWRLERRPLLPLTDPALHEEGNHHG
ncbi:MAG: hypothetical protein L0Z62_24305 [Gemmataceae bacterium]|nr:hypothetical protein [Gemmataceae bacterium]